MSYINAGNFQNPHHHTAGHNRQLYIDSPEFVGLSKETHSLHRLLIEQAESMENMMSAIAKIVVNKETKKDFDAHHSSSEDEDHDE